MEQHYFTVRGRGFDHKQWKAVTELAEGIIRRAKEAGILVGFEADARRIVVTASGEEEGSPLVIWRKGEPGIPREVTTRGQYDAVIQSVLTAAKKVAPDIIEMCSPDGRDYRRILAKMEPRTVEKIKELVKKTRQQKDDAFNAAVRRQKWVHPETKNQVEFVSLPKREQTAIRHRWDAEYGHRFDLMAERATKEIREAEKAKTEAKREKAQAEDAAEAFQEHKEKAQKGEAIQPKKATTMKEDAVYRAAIRVAASTEDKSLKLALLEILRPTIEFSKEAENKEEDEKEGRHEEGKSIDVGDYLKSKGHGEDAAKWEKHEGEVGKKSSVAIVFPDIYELAWRRVIDFSRANPESKTASGSTAERVAAADRLAKKWIQEAIKRPGRVHEYLGIPEGEEIPVGKLSAAIEKGTGNKSLLSALLLAKRLEEGIGKKATEDEWLTEENLTKAATEVWGSEHLAKKWISDAIKRPGRVREYLGVPEGQEIPMGKLNAAIEKVKGTGNKSLLSALLLAKRLKGGIGKKKAEEAA